MDESPDLSKKQILDYKTVVVFSNLGRYEV